MLYDFALRQVSFGRYVAWVSYDKVSQKGPPGVTSPVSISSHQVMLL